MRTAGFRRHAALLLACCLAFFLSGCRGEGRSILFYQEAVVSLTLAEGERVAVLTRCRGGWTVAFTAPAALEGVSFVLTETDASVFIGGKQMPVPPPMREGVGVLLSLLSLTEERCSAVRREPDGSTAAVFSGAAGETVVYLGEDGLPRRFVLRTERGERDFAVLACQVQDAESRAVK